MLENMLKNVFQQILVFFFKMRRKAFTFFVLIYINCKGGGLGAAEAPRSYRVKAIILCVLGVSWHQSSIWYLIAKSRNSRNFVEKGRKKVGRGQKSRTKSLYCHK